MKQEYPIETGLKEAFQSYVTKMRNQIESELAGFLGDLTKLSLHPQIKYAVLSQGKRLRPLLVTLSAQSVGGNPDEVTQLALAFEFMHTATLVHDDVIDQDEMRRDKPALHNKWSVNDAILTGDALIALAVDLSSHYGEVVLKTVAQSALELCDGEHIDITNSLKTTTEESYFKRIKEKSASLFRAAAFCGALVGGGTCSELNSLSSFGENFGIAYQLRDDTLDLPEEGTLALKDFKGRRITLPLIHFYANNTDSNKRKLLESKLRTLLQANSTTNKEDSKNILEIVSQAGSLDYCEKRIEQHLDRAVASLSSLKDTEYKAYLIEMTKELRR